MGATDAIEPLTCSNTEVMDVPDLPRDAFDMDNILDPPSDQQNHGIAAMEMQEVRFAPNTECMLYRNS